MLRINLLLVALSIFQTAPFKFQNVPESSAEQLLPGTPEFNRTVQVQYLGVAGYMISRGRHAILPAPLYSNPNLVRVGLLRIKTDTTRVDLLHPRPEHLEVGAILVGHAHYDHLLDVPYIARKYHKDAHIYGNRSTYNIVVAADENLRPRSHALVDNVSRNGEPGSWFYVADSTIRFMAIASGHGPHAVGIHVMKGKIPNHLRSVPRSAWKWKEGETLAYLIDFMGEDGSIDFRIHYTDATQPQRMGFIPDLAPEDTHRVDLAIVCAGSAHVLGEYPYDITVDLKPRHVMIGHWEDFFISPLKKPRRLRFLHLEEFIDNLEKALLPDADWLLPDRGGIYHYPLND